MRKAQVVGDLIPIHGPTTAPSPQLTSLAVAAVWCRAHPIRLQTPNPCYLWDDAATDRQNQNTINP